ncbi:methyl-accepting chemotaxis protein [Oceanobacillus manasiensis]|uniref:methyl-accepting chemotaxis protein n=1 Tax=Oceanobacillus manasiensis TaxID=586413 RepID=UPI0005AA6556|nr:methyl-accepting chemotaxis protein [Oceanobacillus manasiensis]
MKRKFGFKHIKSKILFGFGIVIFLVVLLSFYNGYTVDQTNEDMKEMTDYQLELLITQEKVTIDMQRRTSLLRGYLLYGDPSIKEQFNEGIDASIALENKLLELNDSDDVQQLMEKKIEWGTFTDEVIAEYDNGNEDRALEIMALFVQPLEEEITRSFQEMAASSEDEIQELGRQIVKSGETNFWVTIGIAVIVIITGLLIAFVTTNKITKPILTVMQRMKEIASGNLRHEDLMITTRDELSELYAATNLMTNNTREMILKIGEVSNTVSNQSEELTQSADEVKAGSEQVAVTMEELANGTEEQATNASSLSSVMATFTKSVQETNESGENIQATSKNVLAKTQEGASLMDGSKAQMLKIDQIVREAVVKVQGLDQHTQHITQLVSVIQDIAEQTNLLALNAAIEAARAGESGKGFSVVADEVRKLAEEVAKSISGVTDFVTNIQTETRAISISLNDSYKEVEQGTEKIESTSVTFTEINHAVTTMVDSIQSISANLADLAGKSGKMNHSIEEIAAIAEESAAGVEETSASSEQTSSAMEAVANSSKQLANTAEELNNLVTRFKV